MRNVKRGPLPEALRKNSGRWTRELLKAIEGSKKSGEKVPDKYYNKYKHDDVKEELMRMYGDGDCCYCCYCESIINDVSYEQIDHRLPKKKSKDKYPEKTFDWNNLHLSCGKCNGKKGNKYDEKHPILDATNESESLKTHLGYKLSADKGVYRETLSERGITTVEHADLDRASLRNARLILWHATTTAIDEIKRLGSDPRVYTHKKMLRDMCRNEHGSLIEYLLDKHEITVA